MAKSDTKSLTESRKKLGRPTKYDEEIARKLESAFQAGVTDETACEYVGIDKQTLYNWYKKHPKFLDRIQRAKRYLRIAAGLNIQEDIAKNKSIGTSKWWLEKKHPDEFHPGGNVNVNVDNRQVYVTLPERNKE